MLLGRLLLIAGSFWSIVRRFDLCARFKCLAALFVVVAVVVTLPASRRCRCKFVLFVAHTHRDIHTQADTAGRQASASSSLAVYSNFIAKLPTGSAGRESERASKRVNIYVYIDARRCATVLPIVVNIMIWRLYPAPCHQPPLLTSFNYRHTISCLLCNLHSLAKYLCSLL